jgi:hypothetical protein
MGEVDDSHSDRHLGTENDVKFITSSSDSFHSSLQELHGFSEWRYFLFKWYKVNYLNTNFF